MYAYPSRYLKGILLLLTLVVASCDAASPDPISDPFELPQEQDAFCSIPSALIVQVTAQDGIPSLDNPKWVNAQQANYLSDDDLVVGLKYENQQYALPHLILRWHEVVNLPTLTVTYCPLTGSALAFNRAQAPGSTFGVSGLLYRNNLILYDRTEQGSLWSQMKAKGICGPEKGVPLEQLPVSEMTWAGWKALHPNTKLLSLQTDFDRNYLVNPYGNYDEPSNERLLYSLPEPLDARLLPKSRVLFIPAGKGLAVQLDDPTRPSDPYTLHLETGRLKIVVFVDPMLQTAAAYWTENPLQEFQSVSDGYRDNETGSTWNQLGQATSGPRLGTSLSPVKDSYIAFWFAVASFNPEIEIH